MGHEKLTELCPIYALGALDGEELREFETHLRDCPTCSKEVLEFTEVTSSIPQALPNFSASTDLKNRLMARLETEVSLPSTITDAPETHPSTKNVPQRRTARVVWLPWVLAAAAGIMLAFMFNETSKLKQRIASQESVARALSDQLATTQRDLEDQKTITAFLSSPETRLTLLAGTDKSPRATGKILWSAQKKKALFYAAHLPLIPQGKTYQLWIIANNKPIDAGTFSVDDQGNGFLKVESLADADKAQKFAVTLEPAGGVPQPTGAMHLLGSL